MGLIQRHRNNLSNDNVVSYQSYIGVKLGRQTIVSLPSGPFSGPPLAKASPAPVTILPSTSSIIPHTSVLSQNEKDKTSLSFVAKTFSTAMPQSTVKTISAPQVSGSPQVVITNWNANGALNA